MASTLGYSEESVTSSLSQTVDANISLHLSYEASLNDLPETIETLEVESRVEDMDKKVRFDFRVVPNLLKQPTLIPFLERDL